MSQCNRCCLASIRKSAKKRKAKVIVVQRLDQSANVYVNGKHTTWFMRLTEECSC